jgi:hypothetical protein
MHVHYIAIKLTTYHIKSNKFIPANRKTNNRKTCAPFTRLCSRQKPHVSTDGGVRTIPTSTAACPCGGLRQNRNQIARLVDHTCSSLLSQRPRGYLQCAHNH